MCGILGIFADVTSSQCQCNRVIENGVGLTMSVVKKSSGNGITLRELAYQQSRKQRHRGPDHTGIVCLPNEGVAIVHERLAVIGVHTGGQPLVSDDGEIILVANGEIYNYLEISKEISLRRKSTYTARSDCDVLIGLYEEFGCLLLDQITGMFAFVLYDKRTKNILVARDPIGIIPMYRGVDKNGGLWFASEMKCLTGVCETIEVFPPGYFGYGSKSDLKYQSFYQPSWIMEVPNMKVDLLKLRHYLENSVRSHLQCDVQFGALLSGGVDSSLIASIATKLMRKKDPNFRLKTFSVGLKGAPDFVYSRMVADYLGSDHTEVQFTEDDGLDCIREIIYHTESYDVTTTRCSIPMYLLARFIKSEGLKMILSGEGADELLGGYLYFHNAPNSVDFHKETVQRVQWLHYSDCLRANKITLAWGLELRVPFLDKDFVNYVMNIRPEDRMPLGSKRIEKQVLRAAFADNYLPDEVLWRQKEQFSDGVGYNWIDTIKAYAASHVTDEEFSTRNIKYPINTPSSKEAFYYRKIFEEMFPGQSAAKTVKLWIPRTDWGCSEDPSGRSQAVHQFST